MKNNVSKIRVFGNERKNEILFLPLLLSLCTDIPWNVRGMSVECPRNVRGIVRGMSEELSAEPPFFALQFWERKKE